MHQSMQSGSMARAASAWPMSAASHPNWFRMPLTVRFATASLPQMNIVGCPPVNWGFTSNLVDAWRSAATYNRSFDASVPGGREDLTPGSSGLLGAGRDPGRVELRSRFSMAAASFWEFSGLAR